MPAFAKVTQPEHLPRLALEPQAARLLAENRRLRLEVARLSALEELAYRDSLTGLRNRRYFDERLSEELSRARRRADARGGLLCVDVNDFKAINDNFGHQAGDEALCTVGGLLEGTLRVGDICCRTGGDEFTVILPDVDAAGARDVIGRLRAAVARMEPLVGGGSPLSLAIGAALWPADGTDAVVLLGRADAAMYADKQRQRQGQPRTGLRLVP